MAAYSSRSSRSWGSRCGTGPDVANGSEPPTTVRLTYTLKLDTGTPGNVRQLMSSGTLGP